MAEQREQSARERCQREHLGLLGSGPAIFLGLGWEIDRVQESRKLEFREPLEMSRAL